MNKISTAPVAVSHKRVSPANPRRSRVLILAATGAVLFLATGNPALAAADSKQIRRFKPAEDAPPISDHMLDAVAAVESRGENVPGDGGRAAGCWQLHVEACADAGGRHADAWTPAEARKLARVYLEVTADRLRHAMRREPSNAELYAAYNMGFQGFKKRGFSMRRCGRVTRARAATVERMVKDADEADFQRRFEALVERGRRLSNNNTQRTRR